MKHFIAAAVLASALILPASAQNMTLRAPDWATRLVAADLLPTTGGRTALAGEGIDLAVRVTVAPNQGGVARVVRYEAGASGQRLVLRRFTGHPNAGWWLYGPDTPYVSTPPAALRADIDRLARAAVTQSTMGGAAAENCPSGERIYVEILSAGRSTAMQRPCMSADAIGSLARRLSDAAGSRDEEELFAAARDELLAADRAFNAMAQSDGLAAAFARYAAHDGTFFGAGAPPVVGQEAITAQFAAMPAGTRITWTAEAARVSSRGDMGWTWGRATITPPQGAASRVNYVTVWTRDFDGNWRFAADIGTPAP